jgi:hypothetical protein
MSTLAPGLQRLVAPALDIDAATVDRLYGLEPVFEPGSDPRSCPLVDWVPVRCPHCWQFFDVAVDLTVGAQTLIEDCLHCCRAIAMTIEIGADGQRASIHAERAYD